MGNYSIETDPYLSADAKVRLLEHKEAGVDMSMTEKFLRDTAPLMEPLQPKPLSIWPAVIFLMALFVLVWLVS